MYLCVIDPQPPELGYVDCTCMAGVHDVVLSVTSLIQDDIMMKFQVCKGDTMKEAHGYQSSAGPNLSHSHDAN